MDKAASRIRLLSFVIPPFHLDIAITLIINSLCEVELWVEYGWNFM